MADKMITTYNAHSAPTTDDKFFMVGASEEYLIDYDVLASAILDKLTSKTYSGLNNSTVISAILANADDITDLSGKQSSGLSGVSLNTIVDPGVYQIGNMASVTEGPISSGYGTLHVIKARSYLTQVFYRSAAGSEIYVRSSTNSATSWGAWVKQPNRSEVDANTTAVASLTRKTLAWGSYNNTRTITLDDCSFTGISSIIAEIISDSNNRNAWISVRVNQSSSTPKVEPFYGSSFSITINCSSTTYGWGWLQSDNAQSQVYYGRLAGSNWSWYKVANQADLNNAIVGMIGRLSDKNIDNFVANENWGAFYLNAEDSDVTGVKPVSSGSGILYTLRQSSTIARQVFIGVTTSSELVRYYTYSSGTWTSWSPMALRAEVTTLTNKISDYVKAKTVEVNRDDLTAGMSLASYVSLDTGYKFLCWQTLGCSSGWTHSSPIYLSDPLNTAGSPFWDGTLPTGSSYSVLFVYFEVKS